MTSVESLFPITITITKEMIKSSIPINPHMCQGAIALTHALGSFANGRKIVWGVTCGAVDDLPITTQEKYWLPLITSPTKVTFILNNNPPL